MADEAATPSELLDIGKYREKIINGPIVSTFLWLGVILY